MSLRYHPVVKICQEIGDERTRRSGQTPGSETTAQQGQQATLDELASIVAAIEAYGSHRFRFNNIYTKSLIFFRLTIC